MAEAELTILTNMCMVSDGQGNVLVQEKKSPGWSGLTFPGGHVEPGEALTDAVIREIREETGLTIVAPRLRGVKHFHRMDGTRYLVFLYAADAFSGQLRASDEGAVYWVPLAELDLAKCVPDFDHMLTVFLEEEEELFYYRTEDGLRHRFYGRRVLP